MKKYILALFALTLMSVPAFAFEAEVPDFDVYISSEKIEYKETKYPLLLYKDITYFPMTYRYVHMLGLTSSWADGAFYLSYSPCARGQETETEWAPAVESLDAQIARYPIYINGKLLDNSNEEYPVLTARDITYFPLTWRFAAEEFSLLTNWNGSLSIAQNWLENTYIGPGNSLDYEDGDRMWFSNRTINKVIFGEDGAVTYTSSTENPEMETFVFDARTETVTRNQVPFYDYRMYKTYGVFVDEEEGLRLEGSNMMYGSAVLEDVSDELAADAAGENLGINLYGRLYDLGGGCELLETVLTHRHSFTPPHNPYKGGQYIVYGDSVAPLDIFPAVSSIGTSQYKSSELINGVPWLCMQVEPESMPGWGGGDPWYYLYKITPGGAAERITDPDHGSLELLGQIDGKPVVRATWQSEYIDVSAVNDGYFTLEADGSLKKLYPYVYCSAATVLNKHLYLLIWRNRTIVDACCGKEISF